MNTHRKTLIAALALAALATAPRRAQAGAAEDRETLARLDLDYQAAVERNDADAMALLLAEDFALVLGDGRAFERRLWFSDTWVRTAEGWRYVFGQASLALPEEPTARP